VKISIITVVFNNCKHIINAIESVLSQDYSSIEYIVIDGGSTDGTLQLIDKYKSEISIFLSEADTGIYDALNKGITLATGEVIGFLHSDDLFSHAKIISQIAAVLQENKLDIIYGDLDYVKRDKVNTVVRHWQAGVYSRDKLKSGWMPPHPSFYARRELYQKTGGFDLSYRIAADYDCMLKMLNNDDIKVYYLPKVFVKMRLGGESNRSIANIIHKSSEDYRILKSNNVGGFGALLCKNLRKIPQFII
jgi:glycosyltransferase involved in cell wall biosynthesis